MLGRVTRERFLSDSELERFMAAVRERRHVHQPRDHALFALLANTGIRPSEAVALTRGDLNLDAKRPWIRVGRLKKKDVRKFDELAIPARLAEILSGYVASPLMLGNDRLFRITRRQIERLFHHYRRIAGLRRVKLYILRHTAGTRIYRATRNIAIVQAVLGHEKPETSAIYAHIPGAVLKELADGLPAFV